MSRVTLPTPQTFPTPFLANPGPRPTRPGGHPVSRIQGRHSVSKSLALARSRRPLTTPGPHCGTPIVAPQELHARPLDEWYARSARGVHAHFVQGPGTVRSDLVERGCRVDRQGQHGRTRTGNHRGDPGRAQPLHEAVAVSHRGSTIGLVQPVLGG